MQDPAAEGPTQPAQPDAMPMRRGVLESRRFRWALKGLLTLLFIAFVNRSLSISELSIAFSRLQPGQIGIVVLLGIGGIVFQARRWMIILRYEQFGVGMATALRTMLFGNLLAFVTPGRIGELFRGFDFAGKRKADAVFAVIVDKLYIVSTTVLVGLCCLALQVMAFGANLPRHFVLMSIGGAAVLLIALGVMIQHAGENRHGTVARYWQRFLKMTPRIFTRAAAAAFLYSAIAQILLIVQTSIVFSMFGVDSFIRGLLAAGQAFALMALVPLFIGNMGIREYSFGLFLGQITEAGEHPLRMIALGASVVILVINLILPALIGLLWSLIDASRNGSGYHNQ